MKRSYAGATLIALYVWFLILVLRTANAVGQTLAPVSSGFDFWPLVIVAIIAAAGFGFYLWHKRNPSAASTAAASAVQTVQSDLAALAHKATDQVSKLTDLARQQAVVIASPPVQAAINAPAPAAVTPLPPMPAPSVAPTPIPAASPVVVAVAPTVAEVAAQQHIATAAPAPVPTPVVVTVTPEDMAERAMVEKEAAFGWGSPPYVALLARGGGTVEGMNAIIQKHMSGFQGGKPMRVTPVDWGYQWNGNTWISPADPVGGQYNPATQRFE
jgi:hypothetical protein